MEIKIEITNKDGTKIVKTVAGEDYEGAKRKAAQRLAPGGRRREEGANNLPKPLNFPLIIRQEQKIVKW